MSFETGTEEVDSESTIEGVLSSVKRMVDTLDQVLRGILCVYKGAVDVAVYI